ncbi:N-6 DNA methylase [Flavobacterium sp. U410]
MPEIIYSNPLDVISSKVYGIFDAFRSNSKLNTIDDSFQIVLLLISLYKDGVINESSFTNDFDVQELKSLIHNSSLNLQTKEGYIKIVEALSSSLAMLFSQPLNYFSFLFFQLDRKDLINNFSGLFDSILHKFFDSIGKYSGEFLFPDEISKLMLNIAKLNDNATIYNPFAGPATFGILSSVENRYIGQEINIKIQIIGMLRLLATNSNNLKSLMVGDSIFKWNPTNEKFDLIISSPPFNMSLPEKILGKWGTHVKVESFFIEKSLESINNNGKVVMIIPEGFLTNKSNTFSNLRSELVQNDLLEMVISLPSGIFKNTAIRTSILVLNKAKIHNGFVRFVKSDNFIKSQNRTKILDWEGLVNELNKFESSSVKTISNSEIIINDNLLNVNRYFLEQIQNGVKLNEILISHNGIKISDVFESRVVNIKDIKGINVNIDELEIKKEYNKTFFRKIEMSCLLIAPSSNYLKASWFEYTGEPIIVKHNIKAFKVDQNKIDITYLIQQLNEDYVKKQLNAFTMGSVMPLINVDDILKLEISLPSLVEQKDWVNKKFLKSLDFEKDKVSLIRKQFNEELGSKQHNIRQHLKNVKDSLDVLVTFMDKNNGVLKKDDIINPLRGITVLKRIESLQASLSNVIFEVNNLTNESNFSNTEKIDLIQIINETIEEHVTSNYEIDFKPDELIFQEIKNFKYEIEFSKRDFKELINNVIENAVNHGFIDKAKQYKLSIYLRVEDDKIVLQMVNNGLPFPKDVSKSFGIKGFKAGKTGNKGIGVWKIIQTVLHFGHEYSVIDEPNAEFPAGWIFKFNINN